MSMLESKLVVGLEMNNTADIEELPSNMQAFRSVLLQFCKTVIIIKFVQFAVFVIAVVMGKNLSDAIHSEMSHCCCKDTRVITLMLYIE